ncbi:MAG: hypothetical protein H0X38_06950 [Planctomycetes bacterium]|nr:hypothetical protein [Planctomycetota bacterium]
MVSEARSITLLRLTSESPSRGEHREEETTGDGIVLGEADFLALKGIFADPASFKAVQYACEPQYGVTLRFEGPRGRLDVLLCFGCSEITMIAAGTMLASTEFDPVKPTLVTLMKRLLPQDEQIRALK